MSIDWEVDEENVIHPCNAILFVNKMVIKAIKSVDIWHNMAEYWKHAKWKKPVTQEYILYDLNDMKHSEQANSQWHKVA